MREILFRGKGIARDEWITGFLVDAKHIGCWVECDPVRPETVGQFTGLLDKNEKKIFEGDIVKHYNRDDNPAAFDVGRIFWDTKKCRWLRTAQKCDYNPEVWSSSAKNYVVIGNIHDNPELLRGNGDV